MAQDTNRIVGRSCRRGLGEWSLPSDTWESVSVALREIWTPWSEPNRGHQVGLRCWSPCCVRRVQEGWDCSAWKTESSGEILLLPAPTKCEMYNSRGRRPTWEPENRGKKTGNTKTNKQKKQTNHKLKNIGIGSQRSFGICILAGAFSNLIYLCVVWGWLDEMTSRSSFQCNFILLHSLSLIIWMWYKYYTTCTSWFKICLTHYYLENQPLCSLE